MKEQKDQMKAMATCRRLKRLLLGMCMWKWDPFTELPKKHLWGPTHGRSRCCKIYWDRHRRLPQVLGVSSP